MKQQGRFFAMGFAALAFTGFLASTARADFSGHYQGTGTASDSNGWEAPCTLIDIDMTETAEAVTISRLSFACGALADDRPVLKLDKRAGELYVADKKVGSITDITMDFTVPMEPIEGNQVVLRMKKTGEQLGLQEDWITADGAGFEWVFGASGVLKK